MSHKESSQHREPSQPPIVSPIDWEYICKHCSRGFNPEMAHQIVVRGPHEAGIMCPWCNEAATYHPPEEIKRPPAVVGTSTITHDGHTIARLFFEGGAWLQYREAPDGWVYEEMFTAEGEKVASFEVESDRDDCDPPQEYLHRAKDRHEKYTVRGLRLHCSHTAAGLLD